MVILSTLLPVVCINNDSKEQSDFSVGLKVFLYNSVYLSICIQMLFILST